MPGLWGNPVDGRDTIGVDTATPSPCDSSRTRGYESSYREALAAAELANAMLRMELQKIEAAWAEEHASLLQQLAHKDALIWQMAQQQASTATTAAKPLAKPPRLGHCDKPASIATFDLRGAGAMALTPVATKGRRPRPAYTVGKPAWDSGACKSKQVPLKPKPALHQKQPGVCQGLKAVAAGGKLPTGKKKCSPPVPPKKGSAKTVHTSPPPLAAMAR
mmetsp:Transcript_18396/g.47121  ORF Transcript_18396/g.47121 Transcript_18396/m.47121 type:complete len:219 (+) Transcript_18396:46-702(+)